MLVSQMRLAISQFYPLKSFSHIDFVIWMVRGHSLVQIQTETVQIGGHRSNVLHLHNYNKAPSITNYLNTRGAT